MAKVRVLKVGFKILAAVVVAACAGYFSVEWGFHLVRLRGESLRNGPWQTSLSTGSGEAGMYRRAVVAKHGIWALASTEVIYYNAETDSDGVPLRNDATYRIEGKDIDTRWWSITAYVNDHFVPNPDDRYSYSRTTVRRESDGSWVITAAPTSQDRNWLPTGNQSGLLVLALRCYNPGEKMLANPVGIALPKIVREK